MSHKVFRDAIHNMITLEREERAPAADPVEWGDALLLELIDTPEVQRLRRIKQLGLAAHIYPSAEHSRFSHSLGVMHLARRILASLLRRDPHLLDRPTLLQVKTAALLHDIGHGPFSHVFEHLYAGVQGHEGWSRQMIRRPGPIRTVITRHCGRLGLEPEGFIAGVAGLLGDPELPTPPVGRQVISSQLDADRMDYLLRDAHFSGVSYGNYDLEWLIHSLRVQPVAGVPRLCVDLAKGPTALESYIAARDHMYRQVYDHKTVRAFEGALIHMFQTLGWIWEQEGALPPGTPPELRHYIETLLGGGQPDTEAYLALDDAVLTYAMGHWAATPPATGPRGELAWKSRLLRERRPVYRRLRWLQGNGTAESGTEEPSEPGETAPDGSSDLIRDPRVAQALDQLFRSLAHTPLPVETPGAGNFPVPLGLLVHVDRLERTPYAHLQYTADRADPVYVVDGSQRVRPAEHASARINFLGHSRRSLARVFVDPRAEGAVCRLLAERFTGHGVTVRPPGP